MSKIQDFPANLIFKQDGAPPHLAARVQRYLDINLPQHGIGAGGKWHGPQGHQSWHL